MATKYQVTELDRVLQQAKQEFPELEEPNHYQMANELLMRDIEVLKKKIQELEKREETHKHIVPNLQAWRDRHAVTIQILEKSMSKKEEEIEELKQAIHLYDDELTHYRKLKSECHKDIEKVWMYDTSIDYSEKNRSLAEKDSKERSKIIERVFYKIANEWID